MVGPVRVVAKKIRTPLKTEVEKDLGSGILLEIGSHENQLVVVNPFELSRFQVDLCIEAAVKHALILAGALKQPANLLGALDRARVEPSQRSVSDRSQPVEQLFLLSPIVEPRSQQLAAIDFPLTEPPWRRRASGTEGLRSASHPSPTHREFQPWPSYGRLYFNMLYAKLQLCCISGKSRRGNTNEQSRTDSNPSAATSLLALGPRLHARTHLGAFVDGFLIEAWRLEITHPRRMRSVALEFGFTFASKLILETDFGRSNSTAS